MMEIVQFAKQDTFKDKAEALFAKHKALISTVLPSTDIQHVGSTAIPGSLTKGDLDIQVRVAAEDFDNAVQALSNFYLLNEGSTRTETFRAFKDDTTDPPLGVQLTVIDSELDIFWRLRDVLLMNDLYRLKYDELKKNYEGKDMEEYRAAKNEFFEWLMSTPEYNRL